MRRDERGPWYLLTGLLIGAALGLFYAWWIRPVTYTNTTPGSLRAEYKDQYRSLIASAYLASGDLVRAKARLELLNDSDVYRTLAEQAQRTLADGSPVQEARALGVLAVALGQAPPTVPIPSQTAGAPSQAVPSGSTGTPAVQVTSPITATFTITDSAALTAAETATLDPGTATPSATLEGAGAGADVTPAASSVTPLPTRTPTPAPGAPFVLSSRDLICDTALGEPLVQVQALDAAGSPVPGVEVIVNWEGGEDHFFTGLKPELGLGYADFAMTPGIAYTLRLTEGGEPVADLIPSECEADSGERFWGAWMLVFAQP